MAMQSDYGPSAPTSQGYQGGKGPAAPGSGAPSPATTIKRLRRPDGTTAVDTPDPGMPSGGPVLDSPITYQQAQGSSYGGSSSGAEAAPGGIPSVPQGYKPPVNRDGTIPDPAPPPAPVQAQTSGGIEAAGPPPDTRTANAPPPGVSGAAGPGITPPVTEGGSVHQVPPGTVFQPPQALSYIEGILGRALTQAERTQAAGLVGWDGASNLSGEQVNRILAELGRLTGAPVVPPSGTLPPGQGGPAPVPPGGAAPPPGAPPPSGQPGGPQFPFNWQGPAPSALPPGAIYTPGQLPGEELPNYTPGQTGPFSTTSGPLPLYEALGMGQFNPNTGEMPTYQGQNMGGFQSTATGLPTYQGQNMAGFQTSATGLPTYQGHQVGGFFDPTSPQNANLQNQLMSRVLSSPESLNSNVTNMMKEQNKEGTLSILEQLRGANNASAARRGAYGGGSTQVANTRAADQATSQITQGNRNIDMEAARTNMSDRLNALGMSDQIFSGQSNRALGAYGANLQGAGFNATEAAKQHASQADAQRFTLDKDLAAHGANLQTNQFNAGESRAAHASAADAQRFAHDRDLSSFGANLQANQFNAGERGRQYESEAEKTRFGLQRDKTVYDTNLSGQQFNAAEQARRHQSAQQREQFTLDRDQSVFDRNLAGSQFNAGENQFAYGSQVNRVQNALQRALSQENLNQQGANSQFNAWQAQNNLGLGQGQLDLQRLLGQGGLNLDSQRLQEMARQFNQNFQGRPIDWASLMNDMIMGRANYGANLANMGNMNQNSLFSFLFGNRGIQGGSTS